MKFSLQSSYMEYFLLTFFWRLKKTKIFVSEYYLAHNYTVLYWEVPIPKTWRSWARTWHRPLYPHCCLLTFSGCIFCKRSRDGIRAMRGEKFSKLGNLFKPHSLGIWPCAKNQKKDPTLNSQLTRDSTAWTLQGILTSDHEWAVLPSKIAFYKADPWFTSSPCEDAFRPAKFPGIVSKAPNSGSRGMSAQNARQLGQRCQQWEAGTCVLWLHRWEPND